MMFKGNSTRLEMVIEKIHSNKETGNVTNFKTKLGNFYLYKIIN